ncbi:MAG TPA: chitobiase/beta-hexosaminidase C-terminal domain-containing protein, partial [Spirochaetia bacterium]|nr:chitobiase/beta-hexosaminidase C-terminal domain-containing protein [Spirochaetia bacterium]
MSRLIRILPLFALSILLVNCPTTPKPPAQTTAAPAFTPAEGSYPSAQSVAISTTTEGAEIRYTTDGSIPSSTNGTLYSGPIQVSATTTVAAVAYKTGWGDSPVTHATFTITGAVAGVTFSPAGGRFDGATSVTLSTGTDGAQIYFTTDGTDPGPGKGTLYAGPVSVTETQTIKAIAVKQGWEDSAIASAAYTIGPAAAAAVTDAEISEARGALARAKEVDADYYDPENFDAARQLLDEALDQRTKDPESARAHLASSKEKADLAFTNSVSRAGEDLVARMEAAQKRLLEMEADKYQPEEYQKATAGIEEARSILASNDYAGGRARAYQALKDMGDLGHGLEMRLAAVRKLKFDTEQLMKQAEDGELYSLAPGQREKVTSLYLQGIDAWKGYRLDDAEENFGAALEAAKDTIRIAQEARGNQAETKKKADAMQVQVMKSLQEASKLTVVTEDGTVIRPRNWTEGDLQKEIDLQQGNQPGTQDSAPAKDQS